MTLYESQRYIVIPNEEHKITPLDLYFEAYCELIRFRNQPGKSGFRELYISNPMTSGGAIRTVPRYCLPEKVPLVRDVNNEVAEELAQSISDFVPDSLDELPLKLTVPNRIGTRADWSDLEYNLYWLLHIAGISWQGALDFTRQIESVNELRPAVFNNRKDDMEKRVTRYAELVSQFQDFLRHGNPRLNPVSKLVVLPDHELSLGCRFEVAIAKTLGIPIEELKIDTNYHGLKVLPKTMELYDLIAKRENLPSEHYHSLPEMHSPYAKGPGTHPLILIPHP